MSLYLGNTNIAGTQILYSTTGNNTDGAMTQAITTTKLNNCVHKTGSETIQGVKTFTADLIRAHTDIIKGTNPSSPLYWTVAFTDENGPEAKNRLGLLATKLNTNGDVETYIASYLNTNDTNTQTSLKIVYTKSGDKYAVAPASDVNGSIVTTVNKTKAQNGYFKLGNGLIIQWGRASGTITSSNMTITFPTPFTSATSYSVSGSVTSNSSTASGWGHINSCTSTGFKAIIDNDEKPFNWIAIGY